MTPNAPNNAKPGTGKPVAAVYFPSDDHNGNTAAYGPEAEGTAAR